MKHLIKPFFALTTISLFVFLSFSCANSKSKCTVKLREVLALYRLTDYTSKSDQMKLLFLIRFENHSRDSVIFTNNDLVWEYQTEMHELTIENVFSLDTFQLDQFVIQPYSKIDVWISEKKKFSFNQFNSNEFNENKIQKILSNSRFIIKKTDTLKVHRTNKISINFDEYSDNYFRL